MKKALPFIIIALVLLVGSVLGYNAWKRKKELAAIQPGGVGIDPNYVPGSTGYTPASTTGTILSGSVTGAVSKICGCEQDPIIQNKIAQYNAPTLISGGQKLALKAEIIAACPCVKL